MYCKVICRKYETIEVVHQNHHLLHTNYFLPYYGSKDFCADVQMCKFGIVHNFLLKATVV